MSESVPLFQPGQSQASGYGPGIMLTDRPELVDLIPDHVRERYRCRPVRLEGNRLTVELADPNDPMVFDDLQLITGFEIEAVACSPQQILTLSRMNVEARVCGPLSRVQMQQTFDNLSSETVEARYIFPLSCGAAVTGFRMRVGDRVIEGEIREKLEARQLYEEGRQAGYRSALLEQERSNVFTVTVGNIPPQSRVEVELTYCDRLSADECELELRIPLVVAPRYIPGTPPGVRQGHGTADDTDEVPDASRISPPAVPPGLVEQGALRIAVEIEHGDDELRSVQCTQHATRLRLDQGRSRIELAGQNEPLNRDFILRFSLQEERLRARLLTSGEHFLLMLTPPTETPEFTHPRDVVLLLDRSASMEGPKLESARAAAIRFLNSLGPQDRFALVLFDDSLEPFGAEDWHDTAERPRAIEWLERARSRGGTEILAPIRWALGRRSENHVCVVLITDGQVGNESAVYEELQRTGSPARFFSLGIDTAVNDAFLRQVARLGRGTCELVSPGEELESALERLSRELGQPLVTDLELQDGGLHFDRQSLAPNPLPDLYAARPVCVLGRCRGQGSVSVSGTFNGRPWHQEVQPETTLNPALGVLWARERVRDLEDALSLGSPMDRNDTLTDLLALSLKYGLVSRATSFVLVDKQERVNPGGACQHVMMPVQVPQQWSRMACLDFSSQDYSSMDFEDDPVEEVPVDDLPDLIDATPIVRVVNLILAQAIQKGASHVHIVPESAGIPVLFRIDGQLEEVMTLPKHIQSAVIWRLRMLAGLSCQVQNTPELARFAVNFDDTEVLLSLSCYPGEQGQRLVIHLQSPAITPRPLHELGFSAELRQRLLELLSRKKGLLLVHSSSESLRWLTMASLLHHFSSDPRRSVAVWDPNWRPALTGVTHLRPLGGMSRDRWLESLCHQDLDLLGVSGAETGGEWKAILKLVEHGTLVLASWSGAATLPDWARVRGYLGVLHVNEVPSLCQCEAWKSEPTKSCTACYNTGVCGHQLVAELLQPG